MSIGSGTALPGGGPVREPGHPGPAGEPLAPPRTCSGQAAGAREEDRRQVSAPPRARSGQAAGA